MKNETLSRSIICIALLIALSVHISFLISLFSEPFRLVHGIHLNGSKSHPREISQYQGFWDPFFHDTDRVPRGLDFFSIYQAGTNFLRSESVYYGVREHRLGSDHLVVPYFSGFRYLPYYAYIYGSLLNLFSPWVSYWLWIIFVEVLLLFNVLMVWRYPRISWKYRTIAICMWLFYTPYYVELHIGQQSMVTTTLLHIVVLSHIHRRERHSNTAYIFSVLWKLNTAIFLPVFLKFKRWKTILILLFIAAALSVPYFTIMENSFEEFSSYFHQKLIPSGPNCLGFVAFLSNFLHVLQLSPKVIQDVIQIWILFSLATCTFVLFIIRKVNFTYSICLFTTLYFLSYQYVWEHHYVMMLPVFSVLVLYQKKFTWIIPWFFCAIPTPYYFFNDPLLSMPQIKWSIGENLFYHGLKPGIIFLVAVVLVRIIKRSEDFETDQFEWQKLIRKFKKNTSKTQSRHIP